MFYLVKNRSLTFGQKVQVYYNLHQKCFSIKDKKTGVVLAHTSSAIIMDAKMKVSETSRQRVIRDRKKNVHVIIEGTFIFGGDNMDFLKLNKLYYNPYEVSRFVDEDTRQPIDKASIVVCNKNYAFYVK